MKKIEVDYTLTPENAKQRGYVLMQDFIYDPDAPKVVNMDIDNLVNKGWILGMPALPDFEENNGVGLYKPIDK